MRNAILTIIVLFLGNTNIAYDQALLMPEDLVEFAEKNGCGQIDDFYKNRPGMLKPPYAYGYFSGPEENSAVFWCQKKERDKRSFFLLTMFEDKQHELARCPVKIEWNNYPGGLSIYTDRQTTLEGFVYLKDPKKKLAKGNLTNNAIRSEYDGVEIIFYCYKGEWLIRQRH